MLVAESDREEALRIAGITAQSESDHVACGGHWLIEFPS